MSIINWSIVSEVKEQVNKFICTMKEADIPIYHQTLLNFTLDHLRENYLLKLERDDYNPIQDYFWGWVDSKFEK